MANTLLQEDRIKALPIGDYVAGVDTRFKYDVSSQIIRGTLTFSKDKLREIDQSYTGYTQIFVTRMPYFMEQLKKGNQIDGNTKTIQEATYHYNNLKALFELASTSYSGTPDMTLNTSDINTGWPERTISAPTSSAYDSTQFTIKCLETRAEPLRNGKEWFINAISDAVGKFADYYGATDDDGYPLEYLLENHTFDVMVIQTDPTLRNIQDISMWRNAFFTDVSRDQLNWDLGTVELVQPADTAFKGIYLPNGHHNEDIINIAKRYLSKRYTLYKRMSDLTTQEYGLTPLS